MRPIFSAVCSLYRFYSPFPFSVLLLLLSTAFPRSASLQGIRYTVITRLTSGPANEFFG